MNDSSHLVSRIAVAQLGARRHYAVPVAFLREGLLEHFFTDIYLKGGWSSVVRCAERILPVSGIRRLAGRTHEQIPPEKVTSVGTAAAMNRLRGAGDVRMENWIAAGQSFCRKILARGLGAADAVYVFSSAAKELLLHCRENGLTGVLDHATAPQKVEMKLVREEQDRFPGWARVEMDSSALERYSLRQHHERELASVIVCGSSFVKKMLMDEGVEGRKIEVVPLGISIPPAVPAVPHEGLHVLFAGGDGLRKGIGYLALAAAALNSSSIQFRAAGDLGLTPRGLNAVGEHIRALGPVPRLAMRTQWAWADVLVLPSVSETFGLVILEAMAEGVAVVTTTSTCGPDVIRDGVDGFVIPPRDAGSLAAKLDYLAARPDHLADMKIRARERAAEFSLEQYGHRLAAAVKGASNA